MNKTILSIGTLVVALTLVSSFLFIPVVAYGKSNWQITFSGNCNNKPICDTYMGGTGGFWGWCSLGGGSTSGNNADCEESNYFFYVGPTVCPPLCKGPTHIAISGSAWTTVPLGAGSPLSLFLITEGSITLAGPSTAAAIAAGAPSPPSCVVANNKQSITCDVATLTGGLGVGVALVQPGHTSNSICAFGPSGPISAPGCHTEQQETQIP